MESAAHSWYRCRMRSTASSLEEDTKGIWGAVSGSLAVAAANAAASTSMSGGAGGCSCAASYRFAGVSLLRHSGQVPSAWSPPYQSQAGSTRLT